MNLLVHRRHLLYLHGLRIATFSVAGGWPLARALASETTSRFCMRRSLGGIKNSKRQLLNVFGAQMQNGRPERQRGRARAAGQNCPLNVKNRAFLKFTLFKRPGASSPLSGVAKNDGAPFFFICK